MHQNCHTHHFRTSQNYIWLTCELPGVAGVSDADKVPVPSSESFLLLFFLLLTGVTSSRTSSIGSAAETSLSAIASSMASSDMSTTCQAEYTTTGNALSNKVTVFTPGHAKFNKNYYPHHNITYREHNQPVGSTADDTGTLATAIDSNLRRRKGQGKGQQSLKNYKMSLPWSIPVSEYGTCISGLWRIETMHSKKNTKIAIPAKPVSTSTCTHIHVPTVSCTSTAWSDCAEKQKPHFQAQTVFQQQHRGQPSTESKKKSSRNFISDHSPSK